jgi:hypothetical protein
LLLLQLAVAKRLALQQARQSAQTALLQQLIAAVLQPAQEQAPRVGPKLAAVAAALLVCYSQL